MVTIDYDGVSTHLMIILMIEFGIWVILATGNFIRGGVPLLKANGYYRFISSSSGLLQFFVCSSSVCHQFFSSVLI